MELSVSNHAKTAHRGSAIVLGQSPIGLMLRSGHKFE
jgi:hypothetical protein